VPVPDARAPCDDPEVVGTPFYVMDFIEGRVFRNTKLPDMAPSERAAVYDQLNDVLARLSPCSARRRSGGACSSTCRDGILSGDRATANSCVDRAQQASDLVAPYPGP
jgi:aminoglycoside phosphotransferase (APT) family kinase protein